MRPILQGEVPAAVAHWDGNKGKQVALNRKAHRLCRVMLTIFSSFWLLFGQIQSLSLLEAVGRSVVGPFFCSYCNFVFISVWFVLLIH